MQAWGIQTAAAPASNVDQPAEPAIPMDAFTKRKLQATMPDAMRPAMPPVGQRIAAGPQTPGIDAMPSRSTADAVAEANRRGAFGTGAQQRQKQRDNLQQRQDLYARMGADEGWQRNPVYRAEATNLGVTDKGWASAATRLAGSGGPAAGTAPQPDTTAIRNDVAITAPKPELPPGQTPAKNSSYAVPWASQPPSSWSKPAGNPAVSASVAAAQTPKPAAPAVTPAAAPMAASPAPTIASTPPTRPALASPPPSLPPVTIGGMPSSIQSPLGTAEIADLKTFNANQAAQIASMNKIRNGGNATAPPTGPTSPGSRRDPINSKDPATRAAAMRKRKNQNWSDPLPNQPGWAASATRWMSQSHL